MYYFIANGGQMFSIEIISKILLDGRFHFYNLQKQIKLIYVDRGQNSGDSGVRVTGRGF